VKNRNASAFPPGLRLFGSMLWLNLAAAALKAACFLGSDE